MRSSIKREESPLILETLLATVKRGVQGTGLGDNIEYSEGLEEEEAANKPQQLCPARPVDAEDRAQLRSCQGGKASLTGSAEAAQRGQGGKAYDRLASPGVPSGPGRRGRSVQDSDPDPPCPALTCHIAETPRACQRRQRGQNNFNYKSYEARCGVRRPSIQYRFTLYWLPLS